ncbi:MAG: hypothetical protein J5712_06130, partial [Lachnospiraceae bacterium]|nr:hypothetical protein [Lachnospiraceae bacterium]
DKEDEDKEDEEDEESEEERLAREEAERLEREAQEAAEREAAEQAAREEEERLAREQAERDAQQSQSGSGSGGGSTANSISYNDLTTEISFAIDSHTTASNYNVRVAFLQNSASSSTGSSGNNAIPMSSLPTMPEQGSVLPGYPGSSYSAIVIPADESGSVGSELAGSISSFYSFTGWYASEADAASNDLSKRITTYSSSSPNSLYPGIARVCSIILFNYNEGCGELVVPTTLPNNIVGIDTYDDGYVILKVIPGTTITLPGAESASAASDHLYVSMNPEVGSNTSFYCYTTDYSADVSGQYYAEGRPSIYNEVKFYYPSETITLSEEDEYLPLYMQFISPVEIRVRTNGETIKVRDMVSYPNDAVSLASLAGPSGTVQALPSSITQSTTPQKWKISYSSTANYDYLLQTVYYGNSFAVPVFEGNTGSEDYHRELLCSYRTSANGPVTTYNYADNDIVMFSPENVEYKNPCKAAVRDGKYVFTVQSVDWVCIANGTDPYSEAYEVANSCFEFSENSPFVIPDDEYEGDGLYKFAINPIDLYNNNGQPGGSTPAFGLTEIAGGSGFGKYIYAPDDIVYSWNSKGSARGGAADDPTACYQASYLGSDFAQYSFVGVQGYRLAGFEIEYYQKGLNTMINKTFLLNERSEYEGLYYNAVPCLTAGTSYAVANKLSLDAVWPDTFDMEYNLGSPVYFTPIFVPAAPVTATLTYTEPNFSSRASKTYLLGDYTLSLNTGTSNYGSVKNLDLTSIAIDYARIGVTNGFVSTGFRSSVGSYQLPTMQGQDPYYELYNNGVLSSGHSWMISHDSNDHIVLKEILTLLAVEDQAAITHYPFANIEGREEEENNTFIRGLKSVGQGSAPSTFTDYRPAIRKVVPAQGEECKYSCFFTREDNQIKFARVFTSSDSFYVSGSGSYSHFYGAITDLMGSDYLGSGSTYLGGYTSVYVYGSSTFCGTPTENDYMGIVNGVEVKRTTFDPEEDPSNIYSFLGLPSGHAGMFRFYNYTGVRITNWDSAYCYSAGHWGDFNAETSVGEPIKDCSYYANMPATDRRFYAIFDYASQTGYPEGYINVCVANVACVINIGIDQDGKAEVDYLTADQMNNLWTGTSGG